MIETVTETWTWATQSSIWTVLAVPLFIILVTLGAVFVALYGRIDLDDMRIIMATRKSRVSSVRKWMSAVVGSVGVILLVAVSLGNIGSWRASGGETNHSAEVEYVKVDNLTVDSSDVAARSFFADRPAELWIKTEEHPNLSIHVKGEAGVARLIAGAGKKTGVLYCEHGDTGILKCSADKSFAQSKPSQVEDGAKRTVETSAFTPS